MALAQSMLVLLFLLLPIFKELQRHCCLSLRNYRYTIQLRNLISKYKNRKGRANLINRKIKISYLNLASFYEPSSIRALWKVAIIAIYSFFVHPIAL